MPYEFTNHSVSKEVLAQRQKLCQLWDDYNILDSTEITAKLVLVYIRALGEQKKKLAYVGKCLLTWEMDGYQTLNLMVYEAQNDIATYQVKISADGKLEGVDHTFNTPKELLDRLTNSTNLVHKRYIIPKDSPLGRVLDQTFDFTCDIAFPQYPPLLLEIALSNQDIKVAQAIIEHPFIEEPNKEIKTSRRLHHMIPSAVESAIKYDNAEFLEYLIDRYDFFQPSWGNLETPMALAAGFGKLDIISLLLKKYPPESKETALRHGLFSAANVGNKESYEFILRKLDKLSEKETAKETLLLADVFCFFGSSVFQETVKQLNLEVNWLKWIEELINRKIDPRMYLKFYENSGNSLKDLPQSLKSKIYLNALACEDAEVALEDIQRNHPDLAPIHGEVLKGTLDRIEKLKILISLGLHPTRGDFEDLLKMFQLGPERLNHFKVLLEGVENQESAKSILSIASAFGLDAMSLVFAKFPELESDKSFLFGMLDETWRGTVSDIDTMLASLTTTSPKFGPQSSGQAVQSKKDFELPIELMIGPQFTSQDIALNTLIFVLLPTGQLETIKTLLLQNPSLIMEFWWKCIFNGPEKFDDEGWDVLAKETLDKLDENQRSFLVRYAFQYGYPALAEFLLLQGIPFPEDKTMIMFLFAINCGDLRLIEILLEHTQIDKTHHQGKSLLHIAVEKNQADIVKLFLKKGAQSDIKDDTGQTPYMLALHNNLVTICKLFTGDKAFSDISFHIQDFQGEELEKWLIKAFLNSNSLDIFKLISILEKKIDELSILNETQQAYRDVLKRVDHFIRTAGTLLVRLPNIDNQGEMFAGYGTGYKSYEEQQQGWGTFCYEWYSKVFDQVIQKNLSLIEVLQQFAQPRDSLDSFQVMRTSNAYTVGLVTDLGGRYYPYWVLGQKIQRAFHVNPEKYQGKIKDTEKGYQIQVEIQPGCSVDLTQIDTRKPFEKGRFRGTLTHSGVYFIKFVQPILAEQFEKIKKYPLEASVTALSEELKREIAYFFWLGCHATPAERGSSQYMVMLHRMVYQMHGFQTAPWSQNYPFPDCVALVMPFDNFYQDYYDSLMEYPPEKMINKLS